MNNQNVSLKWRLRSWWRHQQWFVAVFFVLVAFILGFVGFNKYFAALGKPRSFWDVFYLTLQLFVLESGSIPGPMGWELETARLLAPLISAWAAIKALAIIFQDQRQMLRVRFSRNHVVICGLGRKGVLLTRSFRKRGYRVVAVEQDEDNESISPIREEGIIVLQGNATDRDLLQKARIQKAKYLIVVCGDDGVNAEIAVQARELLQNQQRQALTTLIHIVDPKLCALLREKEMEPGENAGLRVEFFNIFDSGARAWLSENPPFVSEGEFSNAALPNLLIVGLGHLGESLIVHAANKWSAGRRQEMKLPITIIDRNAESKVKSLCLRNPRVERICDLAPLVLDVASPEYQRADFLFDRAGQHRFSGIYVCLDHDASSLAAGLALQQRLRMHRVPIVVRMEREAGLAKLLKARSHGQDVFPILRAFGLLDRTLNPDLILAGTHEVLARSIHEEYVRIQFTEGKTLKNNPSMVSWEELPESLRESNRQQADHIGKKLKAVGCDIVPLRDWEAELFSFTPEEIEYLAQMEHERWLEERRQSGWSYSPGEKDISKKLSPYMVPYTELPEDIKDLDRNTVRKLPVFLAQAGFQIQRLTCK